MELKKVYRAIDLLMDRFRKLTVLDVGVFKVCLLALGVLVGTYAHKACRKAAPLLWLCFIASYAVLIYKLLVSPALRDAQ